MFAVLRTIVELARSVWGVLRLSLAFADKLSLVNQLDLTSGNQFTGEILKSEGLVSEHGTFVS
jgi:hypothetical protein